MTAKKVAAKKAPSQAERLGALVKREYQVVVEGERIKLKLPDPLEAQALRDQLVLSDDASKAIVHLFGSAIALCAGVDAEVGKRLLLLSGGETKELGKTAMRLCGMDWEVAESADLDRPT